MTGTPDHVMPAQAGIDQIHAQVFGNHPVTERDTTTPSYTGREEGGEGAESLFPDEEVHGGVAPRPTVAEVLRWSARGSRCQPGRLGLGAKSGVLLPWERGTDETSLPQIGIGKAEDVVQAWRHRLP